MQVLTHFLLFLSIAVNCGAMSPTSVDFEHFNYEEALRIAESQNKFVFINYNASDVDPCVTMAQTTFRNEEVINLLKSNFISIDANLDQETGKQWIDKFNIDCLPTFMVLDSKGRLEGMNQGSLSTPAFLNWLASLNLVNQRANFVDNSTTIEVISELPTTPAPAPKEKENLLEIKRKLENRNTTYVKKNLNDLDNLGNSLSFEESVETKETKKPLDRVKIPKEENLNDTSSTRSMHYSVQIGAFSKYSNAQKIVESTKKIYPQRYYILEEKMPNGKFLFKVLVGTHVKKEEATKTLNQLNASGVDGYLRRI